MESKYLILFLFCILFFGISLPVDAMDDERQETKKENSSKFRIKITPPSDHLRSKAGLSRRNTKKLELSNEKSQSLDLSTTLLESPSKCSQEENTYDGYKTMEIKSTLQFDKSQHYMMVILPSQKPGHRKISLKNADELKTFTEAYQINTTQPVKEIVSDTKIQY